MKIIIPDKICSHCGGTEWDVKKYKGAKGILKKYECTKKRQEISNKRYFKNRIENSIKVKKYRESNIEHIRSREKIQTMRRKSKKKEYDKKRLKTQHIINKRKLNYKNRSINLSDSIVRSFIQHQFSRFKISCKDIPTQMVKQKRNLLIIHRLLKNKKNDKSTKNI